MAFWKVVSALATSALVTTGLVFHQVSILAERRVSPEAALSSLSLQAAFACIMSLLGGCLADRIARRHLLAASMALAMALLIGTASSALVVPYAV